VNVTKSLFIATLIYKSKSHHEDYQPLFEESMVLIEADSLDVAKDIALKFALSRDTTFTNAYGQTISWTLHQIADVRPTLVDSILTPCEIISRHFSNLEAYALNFSNI
jgi:hypothetical protein